MNLQDDSSKLENESPRRKGRDLTRLVAGIVLWILGQLIMCGAALIALILVFMGLMSHLQGQPSGLAEAVFVALLVCSLPFWIGYLLYKAAAKMRSKVPPQMAVAR